MSLGADLIVAEQAALFAASAAGYAILGEIDHYMRARHFAANVLMVQQDIRGAKAVYEEILDWAESKNEALWIARESNTLGRCALELGNLSDAEHRFERSIQLYRALRMSAEVPRPEWGLALVTLASGNSAQALSGLRAVRGEFHRRQMISEEALVCLDMMDALYSLEAFREIVVLASEVIQTFVAAGMLTSALAAFAYLKDAAKRGTVNGAGIDHVRQFLGRLERQPALLFAPPPEPAR